MKRRRHRPRERALVFPWERTSPTASWLSRRRAGAAALALGLLGAVALLLSLDDRRRRVNATRAAIRSVMVATEAFRADHGRCPVNLAELTRPPEAAGVTGPYLREARLDGWGNPFRYRCPGGKHPSSADVVSDGPPAGLFPSQPIE